MSLSKQARNDQANQTENIWAHTLYVAQAFCEVAGPENQVPPPRPKSGYLKWNTLVESTSLSASKPLARTFQKVKNADML